MQIEVSNGEILDKLSILYIKMNNITDSIKLNNVKREFDSLLPHFATIVTSPLLGTLYDRLVETNSKLWEIEDRIRDKELAKEFDSEFIELARSVYFTNDIRADIKKQINELTNSLLVEEKSYKTYQ